MAENEYIPDWESLPDTLLLSIFNFLPASSVLTAARVCKTWLRVTSDEFLWRDLFYCQWRIDQNIPIAMGRSSWREEYKRLHYHTPCVEREVITEHTDQVLHVSFSHNGKMFATSSKDGFIRVWNMTNPVTLKCKADMKKFTWKYTQFSQFNSSDTLLLVSGVHFGSLSTSGEIAVFSLQGEFEMQSRIINKPYDVFGTWYNDLYLLSGNLYWTGHISSCTALWLNKAYQETESEHESVVMRLFRFYNINASSIRMIMVARCLTDSEEDVGAENSCNKGNKPSKWNKEREAYSQMNISPDELPGDSSMSAEQGTSGQKHFQQMEMFENGFFSTKFLELDEDDIGDKLNGTIEYKQEYREAETAHQGEQGAVSSTVDNCIQDMVNSVVRDNDQQESNGLMDMETWLDAFLDCDSSNAFPDSSSQTWDGSQRSHSPRIPRVGSSKTVNQSDETGHSLTQHITPSTSSIESGDWRQLYDRGTDVFSNNVPKSLQTSISGSSEILDSKKSHECASTSGSAVSSHTNDCDKYLIFIKGSETFTPHQIGIKRIKALKGLSRGRMQLLPNVDENVHGLEREEYDDVDHLIDMHGHIIGMALSPDQRYLYVNSRPWPKNYHIENPLYPPPIAQEIDIHVIDLLHMKEVGTMYRAHKAYTANDECFFIFLDVSSEYVASGAEDKHGYLWDRHYGLCLHKYPHTDVVNSVAFDPTDSEVLITVSDDNTIKVWESLNRRRESRSQQTSQSPPTLMDAGDNSRKEKAEVTCGCIGSSRKSIETDIF